MRCKVTKKCPACSTEMHVRQGCGMRITRDAFDEKSNRNRKVVDYRCPACGTMAEGRA